MECPRCSTKISKGFVVRETCFTKSEKFEQLRCINCCWILFDPKSIKKNRFYALVHLTNSIVNDKIIDIGN